MSYFIWILFGHQYPLLLERGADPNINNPLFAAETIYISLLLYYGSNPNARLSRDGSTPLIWRLCDYHSLKILLENKADPNIRDDKGETALSKAKEGLIRAQARYQNGNSRWLQYWEDVIALLKEYGATE